MSILKKFGIYFQISVIAIISSVNYAMFIFPNKFAPSGIDGICTMIQDASGINIGYLSLLFNIPLIVLAFFKLNREFTIKTTFYIVVFSLSSILLKEYITVNFAYYTESGSSTDASRRM